MKTTVRTLKTMELEKFNEIAGNFGLDHTLWVINQANESDLERLIWGKWNVHNMTDFDHYRTLYEFKFGKRWEDDRCGYNGDENAK